MKDMFCIKIDSKIPKVLPYPSHEIIDDLKYFKKKRVSELNDYDFKIFKSQNEADKWLAKYNLILKNLSNKKICKSRDLPAILYKRRYMVQTLMGEKLQTYRTYPKDWKKGQLFNLHDQVLFLTVKLVSLKKIEENLYLYKFKLP